MLERATDLADRGEYEASLAVSQRAIELDPTNPAAHVAKGWALENLGRARLTEAGDAYRAALHVDEGARLFRRVADTPVEEAERDPDRLEIVGWSRFKAGRFQDAQVLFRRALE